MVAILWRAKEYHSFPGGGGGITCAKMNILQHDVVPCFYAVARRAKNGIVTYVSSNTWAIGTFCPCSNGPYNDIWRRRRTRVRFPQSCSSLFPENLMRWGPKVGGNPLLDHSSGKPNHAMTIISRGYRRADRSGECYGVITVPEGNGVMVHRYPQHWRRIIIVFAMISRARGSNRLGVGRHHLYQTLPLFDWLGCSSGKSRLS